MKCGSEMMIALHASVLAEMCSLLSDVLLVILSILSLNVLAVKHTQSAHSPQRFSNLQTETCFRLQAVRTLSHEPVQSYRTVQLWDGRE